ncbi:hypothetical protein M569_11284 [Genlisea aurea]|uniref:EF-hand domain-containing protein n=1 Tax=Genlisea aurea TaxID=192259 RepID=S8CG32_9LAMI|nr:hypothetical protein M569_11284 [Genlisea aurea]
MKTDVDSIYNMLEEEEENISPDEVQDVFDIFDKNGDGFIDPQELQTILCNLGFEEGADLNNCRRMVEVFDENDDGRIDFDEFVKFIQYTSSS